MVLQYLILSMSMMFAMAFFPLHSFPPLPSTRSACETISDQTRKYIETPDKICLVGGGITAVEHGIILQMLHEGFYAVFGEDAPSTIQNAWLGANPVETDSVPASGLLGRVVCIMSDAEVTEELHFYVTEKMDSLVADGNFTAPVIVRFGEWHENEVKPTRHILEEVLEAHIIEYDLMHEVDPEFNAILASKTVSRATPAAIISIDGAWFQNKNMEEGFDESSIAIFDGLISDKLRQALLDLLSRANGEWNANDGPDPELWISGGLDCTPYDEEISLAETTPRSWGLKEEHLKVLCADAEDEILSPIAAVESILQQCVWPNHRVCRLATEAMLGQDVTQLTANAPWHPRETFAWHVDAEPLLAPPGPWTDAFGYFRNRFDCRKPHLVSCLIYLNDEWRDEWGASTRFLDPPSGFTVEVHPAPGRIVIMDQDVTHSVSAPTVDAGGRPRYSLVWKLAIFPPVKTAERVFTLPTLHDLFLETKRDNPPASRTLRPICCSGAMKSWSVEKERMVYVGSTEREAAIQSYPWYRSSPELHDCESEHKSAESAVFGSTLALSVLTDGALRKQLN